MARITFCLVRCSVGVHGGGAAVSAAAFRTTAVAKKMTIIYYICIYIYTIAEL